MKIKLVGGKVWLRCKSKTLLGIVNKLLIKRNMDITQQCFALLPQVIFPVNNPNFHRKWRWWDWIQVIILNRFYFYIWLNMHQKMHMINQKWNKVQKTNVHSIGKHILIIQIEYNFFAKYCVTNYSCINAVWITPVN